MAFSSPVFILHFLLNISQVLGCNITFQILGQRLGCRLQILLIILEYHGLIVLLQVIRKHVCVHECLTALAKYVDSLFQKLHLEWGKGGVSHLSLSIILAALPQSRTCCAAASPPFSASRMHTICSQTSSTACGSCSDCSSGDICRF